MSNTKQDYKKQRKDLQDKFYSEDIDSLELIELIIEAREQRDYYKIELKKSSKVNKSLNVLIEKTKKQLKKVLLSLN